ncbi:MAG: GreA/GreB family elongation factor [Gammaproteobacteria bacterium]|nr:GreA/GreB family elongation factor [Gammaproteobacteria bacterium]
MGRWRPPAAPTSAYITQAGYTALEVELRQLWRRRSSVVAALAAAAAEGDRSENAEYIYRKKELAGIDRRIRYLQKRLPNLRVIREFAGGERVFFGAWVALQGDTGAVTRYRVVGPDEATMAPQFISMDSPLARAVLKRRVGDAVEVQQPERVTTYTIVAVSYPDADE